MPLTKKSTTEAVLAGTIGAVNGAVSSYFTGISPLKSALISSTGFGLFTFLQKNIPLPSFPLPINIDSPAAHAISDFIISKAIGEALGLLGAKVLLASATSDVPAGSYLLGSLVATPVTFGLTMCAVMILSELYNCATELNYSGCRP